MNLKIAYTLGAALFLLAAACGNPNETGGSPGGTPVAEELQDNICILLDLSDRIEPSLHVASPSHRDRDIASVGVVIQYFRSQMVSRGAFFAKGKVRALFSPPPSSPGVNEVASALRIDLSAVDPQEKKNVYDNVADWYEEGLGEIYTSMIDSKDYVGADIWRFFAEGRAADYCIDPSPDYHNTLIILTDGYLYHEDSVERIDNRTSYVTGPLLSREGLRESGWKAKYSERNYGIIDTPTLPGQLSVLVLEVNPSQSHAGDYAVLESYWSSWFEQMGVDRYRILKTDIPANTKETIERFLSGN